MKIRTKEILQDALSDDLAWRRKELTNLHNEVKTASEKKRPTSLRCAVVMLYAHWEGYIKNAAEYYLKYVHFLGLRLDEVNDNILALCLKQKMKEFDDSNKATYHVEFIQYLKNSLSDKAAFSTTDSIKTGSNLNSDILQEILATLGLTYAPYELKANLIDSQLLNYRNTIAHGNFLPIDRDEYDVLYEEVTAMMLQFKNDVSNACALETFRA